jgi:voltage-gated potassium channel Kch
MARRARLRTRLRYWFDNTMSRGTSSLIGWLALVSLSLIVTVTIALEIVDPKDPNGQPRDPLLVLWKTFASTFSLSVPDEGKWAVLALWFVLALGGIFVVSALVGLLTSGMHRQLEQLRKGRSLVVERDHTVILGWSDQVYTVVSELIEANRSRRRCAIAILAEQGKIEMEDRLRHRIGDTGKTRLVCRTGSPLDLSDLEIVSLNAARSIIVLAPAGLSAEDADSYVLKVLLAINRGPAFRNHKHHVVAAVRDGRNRAVAQLAGGDAVVIDADDISARLVVQTARQPRLSVVYHDLLDYGGDEFYLTHERRLVGQTFGAALMSYRTSCPVGVFHANGTTQLNPPMETVLAPDDKLVILAGDDSSIKLADKPLAIDSGAIVHSFRGPQAPEHTLILGWNGRAVRIIEQLDAYVTAGSTVDILSDRPDVDLAIAQLSPGLRQLAVRAKNGDSRDRVVLAAIDIEAYNNVIVLADDRLDPLAADSRVLVTLLHLRDILAGRSGRIGSIVSEMRDDRDRALAQLTKADDFVVSEQLVSLLMTQISENRHLESVFADLFDSAGAEIYVRPSSYYVRPAPNLTFATVVESACRRGEVAIGYRIAEPGDEHGVVLNPDKAQPMPTIDRVIVLAHG